jgi:copper(I)-binding protein
MGRKTRILLVAIFLAACSPSAPEPGPIAADAWVRAVPPGAGMTAGYLTISNPGSRDLDLIRVTSPDFGKIEMHSTIMEDGMARMRRESLVPVPGESEVVFSPGGRHLMLFRPAGPLSDGDRIGLTLTFTASGEETGDERITVAAEAVVRRGNAAQGEHHH